ncbi:hypothetical protein AVEN_91714-1 [Araneus ventricosus]|uniref:Retrovirus-related Pol polyprotein from transposon TNT 1-94 n=1 Tax=Araneus ventricosus TaxID=182803 RepID=A0A4Y2HH13_ARAVE|nr:hypothetical protein AVEN_91714-1 [Araneus ventricosus]
MNGVAERFNLTALNGVKALLKSSGLSQKFWAEALLCFTYAWNRVCHKNKKTPFELYSGSPRVVESTPKPIVEMEEINNMEPSLTQNVIPCKSIDWVRKAVPRSDGSRTDIYYGIEGTNVRLRSFNELIGYCERNKIQYDKNLFNFSGKNTESGKVSDLLNLNEENLLEVKILRTYKEAIKASESSKWEDAMNRELKVMYEHNVWELVKPLKDAKILVLWSSSEYAGMTKRKPEEDVQDATNSKDRKINYIVIPDVPLLAKAKVALEKGCSCVKLCIESSKGSSLWLEPKEINETFPR